ncbi:MAG: phosphoribosylamine--glycine ligase [Deltaproteobacteria bacterium]|nr:phosphoribosylamine--glycine ligase [Deltaproteobacteria bacterium]MBW1977699.1 phosphoribosylamine--glycine ligase [Deltaproteobacteria bacterium]MBW2299467.1 phosphoribosylamine--glycine ligase [Deltaproteobacteria bacterium]RLB35879.1 MAG: phosphoribosylamine--glycine ligase [Deltaproteobacteria bacterium]
MKVLVYGSGGRDHCLADSYADSQHVDKVYICPGNPGIAYTPKGKRGLIEVVKLADFYRVAEFCLEKGVDLVDVGSENPLEEGLIDILNEKGIRTVGPKKDFVKLESDREFTDKLLQKIGVPKPEYAVFTDPLKAKSYVRNIGYQVVVKANGLAAGKGAIVCEDAAEAEAAIEKIMVEKIFGQSGNKVVIEERKYGTEISFFAYLDGEHIMPLRMFAQDYKPAFDPDDTESIQRFGGNLNTGGTGCYCPHKLLSPWLVNRIIKEIVNPTVNAIYNELGWAYKGVLYFGLNLDPYDNLEVFEINVRHGDPEWEVLARKLSTDLFEIGMAVWEGTLDQVKQVWNNQYYVDVIAMEGRSKASRGWNKGYPGRYGKGHKIVGLDDIGKGIAIYFAGVDEDEQKGLVTYGGRVLHVIAGDQTLEGAREKAYRNIKKIIFLDHNNNNANCMRFRETIGL